MRYKDWPAICRRYKHASEAERLALIGLMLAKQSNRHDSLFQRFHRFAPDCFDYPTCLGRQPAEIRVPLSALVLINHQRKLAAYDPSHANRAINAGELHDLRPLCRELGIPIAHEWLPDDEMDYEQFAAAQPPDSLDWVIGADDVFTLVKFKGRRYVAVYRSSFERAAPKRFHPYFAHVEGLRLTLVSVRHIDFKL